MTSDTRDRLLQGTIDALRTQGIAGVSARTIAAAAGVNQALVFYHFGSVDELLAVADRLVDRAAGRRVPGAVRAGALAAGAATRGA